jgi:hypothetical protein
VYGQTGQTVSVCGDHYEALAALLLALPLSVDPLIRLVWPDYIAWADNWLAAHNLSRFAILVPVGILGIMWTAFLAWEEEHIKRTDTERALEELRQRRPELSAEWKGMMHHTLQQLGSPDIFQLLVWIEIRNTGELPSVARDYHLEFSQPNGNVIRDGRVGTLQPGEVFWATNAETGQKFEITPSQLLPQMTVHPIQGGDMCLGVLIFRPDITQREFVEYQDTAKVTFRDIRNQVHEISLRLTKDAQTTQSPPNFVGLGPIVRSDEPRAPKKKSDE